MAETSILWLRVAAALYSLGLLDAVVTVIRRIRHIRIAEPSDLQQPIIRAFVRVAVGRAKRPDSRAQAKSVVRAIYPRKRRPKDHHSQT